VGENGCADMYETNVIELGSVNRGQPLQSLRAGLVVVENR